MYICWIFDANFVKWTQHFRFFCCSHNNTYNGIQELYRMVGRANDLCKMWMRKCTAIGCMECAEQFSLNKYRHSVVCCTSLSFQFNLRARLHTIQWKLISIWMHECISRFTANCRHHYIFILKQCSTVKFFSAHISSQFSYSCANNSNNSVIIFSTVHLWSEKNATRWTKWRNSKSTVPTCECMRLFLHNLKCNCNAIDHPRLQQDPDPPPPLLLLRSSLFPYC